MSKVTDSPIKYNNAVAYDKMMGVWSQILGSQFLDWKKPSKNKSWIDIGCGSGAFTEQIIEICEPCDVHGLDPSPEQVQFAKNRISFKSSSIQIGDAMSLPFANDTFDYATMALVLFFVSDPSQGVSEMKRVVKKGGVVSAYVWDVFGGGLPVEIIHYGFRKMGITYPIPPSAEASKLENLNRLWRNAGFGNISTKKISALRRFKNFDDLWDNTLLSPALQPVLKHLSTKNFDTLKEIVRKNLIQSKSGEVSYTATANAIKGTV